MRPNLRAKQPMEKDRLLRAAVMDGEVVVIEGASGPGHGHGIESGKATLLRRRKKNAEASKSWNRGCPMAKKRANSRDSIPKRKDVRWQRRYTAGSGPSAGNCLAHGIHQEFPADQPPYNFGAENERRACEAIKREKER